MANWLAQLQYNYADPIGVDQLKRKNALAERDMAVQEQNAAAYRDQLDMTHQAQQRRFAQEDQASQAAQQKALAEWALAGAETLSRITDPATFQRAADYYAAQPQARALNLRREDITPENVQGLLAQARIGAGQAPAQEDPQLALDRQRLAQADEHFNARLALDRESLQLDRDKVTRAGAAAAAKDQQAISQAWNTYETARNGVISGLAGTETGPIAGRIPAVTAAQQTAEGAVSAMAPVLKQLFRVAGEGTFTDRDQALLLEMVPKRTDHPEARQAKLDNIDAIVRAKLGMPPVTPAAPAGAGGAPEPVRVRSLQEARALAPGTVFLTPDGRRKVR